MGISTLGTYQMAETLGRSALGVTFASQGRGGVVAVKVLELREDITESERRKAASDFRRRADAIATLFHPNIVALRDYGVVMPYLYTVAGVLVAGSLGDPEAQQLIRLPLAAPVVLGFVQQIANALAEAHRAGVVHGNLKPNNLFLAEERNVERISLQIGDFLPLLSGLDAIAVPFGQRRVLRYLAPEAENGLPVTASDQFALATLAYEWLTGRAAFADVPMRQRSAIAPATDLVPGLVVFSEIDAVFARAFAVAPGDRFANISDFAQALTDALKPPTASKMERLAPRDPNDTRPSQEMPVVTPEDLSSARPSHEMPAVPAPPPQAQASAFLLDGDVGPRPATDLLRQMDMNESLAGVALPGASGHGKRKRRGKSDPAAAYNPLVRGPTTREQELMAPPAPRRMPRDRRAQRAAKQIPPSAPMPMSPYVEEEALPEWLSDPVRRRTILKALGGVTLGVLGVAGAVTLVRHFSGDLTGLNPFQRHLSGHVPAPAVLAAHTGPVQTLAFSPDGTRLASGAAGDALLHLWDPTHPSTPLVQFTTPAGKGGVTDCSWARDSHYLLVSADGSPTQVWNVSQQAAIAHLLYHTTHAQWHPSRDVAALCAPQDKAREANGGKNVLIWDLANSALVGTLHGHTSVVQSLGWYGSKGMVGLASGDQSGAVYVWEGNDPASMAAVASPRTLGGAITGIAWSSQEPHFVTGSASGAGQIFADAQAQSVAAVPTTGVSAVTWLVNTALVAVGTPTGQVILYDAGAKRALLTLAPTTAAVQSLAWSPGGQYLAAGAADHHVYLYDTSQIG